MATDLTKGNVRIELGFTQTVGNNAFARDVTESFGGNMNFATGTGAKQANRLPLDEITIPGGETLTVDLTAVTYSLSGGGSGSILDPGNSSVGIARVKGLYFELVVEGQTNPSLSATVNGAAANVVTSFKADLVSDGTVNARAAVSRADAAGWVVTNTTADKIVVVNNDGTKAAHVLIGILGAAT
jgi:hypothetical protein